MRNLLLTPSPTADDVRVEAADWAEITAVFRKDGIVSRQDLARAIQRRSGIRDQKSQEIAEDVFTEFADRVESCGAASSELNQYPFSLESNQALLSLRRPFRLNSNFGLLYWFLLFATRADMGSQNRTLDGVDPTKVFEQLCADVLCNFWGGGSKFSGAMVVGTAGDGSQFERTVARLCKNIGEGNGWKPGAVRPGAGDGKLDIAAWRRFADKRQGGLIGFAQCKTGIHWREHLTKLRPETYCRRFMQKPLIIVPLRLYMVPNRIVSHRWEEHTSDGGLLMDRCRLVQYGSRISHTTLRRCKIWMHAAYRRQQSLRVTF